MKSIVKKVISSLFDLWRREKLLFLAVSSFTIFFSNGIFEWYYNLIFIFIYIMGRMKVPGWKMTIATYLIILTFALNAVGLKQQNTLSREQLKQFKCEEKREAVKINSGDRKLNSSEKR